MHSSARKPEGGFRFIFVFQLCMAWWAYREQEIRLVDLRVWFAVHELVARRCQLKREQTANYTCKELHRLMGGGGDIPASLHRLQARGLLTWEQGIIQFPEQPPPGQEWAGLAAMLAQVRNHRRRVPVPRRVLRFIAGGCGRVVTATILGHLLCCLYYRQGYCKADGFCKASWIAKVFSVNVRNVKAARRYLEDIGFLHRTEVPQWVRNRYGQKMTINLQWEPPAAAAVSTESLAGELPPPSEFSTPELPPLDSHTKLPTGNTHQEPAAGRLAGVLTVLFQQVREVINAGISPLVEPEPVVLRSLPPCLRQQPPVQRKQTVPMPPPTLHNICLEDLKDTTRLLALYTQAIHTGLIGNSEAERLTFVGLAQHVLTYRPENAGGLFRQLLVQRHFHFVSQEDEDTAQQRLKHHLYEKGLSVPQRATG